MNLELISRIFYLEREIERLETLESPIAVSGGSITLLETQTLIGTTSPITFLNIDQTYTHLLFIGSLRSDIVDEADATQFHFNGIGLPNAAFHSFITRWAGSPKVSQNFNLAQRLIANYIPGANAPANFFGTFNVWVYFYTMIDRNRSIQAQYSMGQDITPDDIEATEGTSCGHWINTASPISRVDFETWNDANDFIAGSTISMYGVSGS